MVQKAKKIPTTSDRLKNLANHKSTLYALNRSRISPTTSSNATFSINGGSAGGSTSAASNSLRTEGDTMIGPIAFYPKIAGMANGQINVSETSGSYSSKIIVTPEAGSTDTLITITGAAFAGQFMVMQGVTTNTITIKDSTSSGTAWVVSTSYSLGDIVANGGTLYSCKQAHTSASADEPGVGANWTDYWYKGNIETIDGTDFSLADDDNLIFVYDSIDVKWQQVTTGKQNLSGGPGGASFPLDYSVDDQGTKSSGTVTHDLSASTAHMLKFTIGGDVTVAFSNYPTSGTGIDWYVEVTQDGTGGHTITWPIEVNPKISLTETAGTVSMIAFHTNDGGTTVRSITLLNAVATSVTNLSNIIIDTDFDAGGTYKYILDADNDTYLIANTDDRIKFFTAGTEKLRLDTELQLQGGVNFDANGNDIILDVDADTYIHSNGDDQIEFYSGGGNRLTITGIGVVVPASVETKLNDLLSFDTGITTPVGADRNMLYAENLATDELVINGMSGGSVRFDFDGTEHMGMNESEIRFTGNSTSHRIDVFFERTDAIPSANDIISKTSYLGDNSIGNPVVWATQTVRQTDVRNGSENAEIDWSVVLGNSALFQSYTMGQTEFIFKNDEAIGDLVIYRGEPTTPATGVIGKIEWRTEDANSTVQGYGDITVQADDITAGNETSTVIINGYNNGAKEDFINYEGGSGVTIVDGNGADDRLAFFNSVPVIQQTSTNITPTADLTYSSNERDMINDIWDALVAYGLIDES